MKDDSQLRRDVDAELEWDPRFDARDIGVAVKHGVVTLSGHVVSYSERWCAEDAAGKVEGIKGIANEIEVRLSADDTPSDTQIAEECVEALRRHVAVPPEAIKVIVRDGWVALEGRVDAMFRKQAAESAVRFLPGVRGLNNLIAITPRVAVTEVKAKIESAFQRRAQLHSQKIHVMSSDGMVTLSGEVPTWQERRQAETAAWAAPGVAKVENLLLVRP